jgi:hypothetical protein
MVVFSLPLCYRLSVSPLPPTCLVLTVSEARSYFESTIIKRVTITIHLHIILNLLLKQLVSHTIFAWKTYYI